MCLTQAHRSLNRVVSFVDASAGIAGAKIKIATLKRSRNYARWGLANQSQISPGRKSTRTTAALDPRRFSFAYSCGPGDGATRAFVHVQSRGLR